MQTPSNIKIFSFWYWLNKNAVPFTGESTVNMRRYVSAQSQIRNKGENYVDSGKATLLMIIVNVSKNYKFLKTEIRFSHILIIILILKTPCIPRKMTEIGPNPADFFQATMWTRVTRNRSNKNHYRKMISNPLDCWHIHDIITYVPTDSFSMLSTVCFAT